MANRGLNAPLTQTEIDNFTNTTKKNTTGGTQTVDDVMRLRGIAPKSSVQKQGRSSAEIPVEPFGAPVRSLVPDGYEDNPGSTIGPSRQEQSARSIPGTGQNTDAARFETNTSGFFDDVPVSNGPSKGTPRQTSAAPRLNDGSSWPGVSAPLDPSLVGRTANSRDVGTRQNVSQTQANIAARTRTPAELRRVNASSADTVGAAASADYAVRQQSVRNNNSRLAGVNAQAVERNQQAAVARNADVSARNRARDAKAAKAEQRRAFADKAQEQAALAQLRANESGRADGFSIDDSDAIGKAVSRAIPREGDSIVARGARMLGAGARYALIDRPNEMILAGDRELQNNVVVPLAEGITGSDLSWARRDPTREEPAGMAGNPQTSQQQVEPQSDSSVDINGNPAGTRYVDNNGNPVDAEGNPIQQQEQQQQQRTIERFNPNDRIAAMAENGLFDADTGAPAKGASFARNDAQFLANQGFQMKRNADGTYSFTGESYQPKTKAYVNPEARMAQAKALADAKAKAEAGRAAAAQATGVESAPIENVDASTRSDKEAEYFDNLRQKALQNTQEYKDRQAFNNSTIGRTNAGGYSDAAYERFRQSQEALERFKGLGKAFQTRRGDGTPGSAWDGYNAIKAQQNAARAADRGALDANMKAIDAMQEKARGDNKSLEAQAMQEQTKRQNAQLAADTAKHQTNVAADTARIETLQKAQQAADTAERQIETFKKEQQARLEAWAAAKNLNQKEMQELYEALSIGYIPQLPGSGQVPGGNPILAAANAKK